MKVIRHIFLPDPKVLYLEPVFGCNYRCFACLHGSGRAMAAARLKPSLFEKLKPLIERVNHIHITGLGEPLLNAHLPDYLAHFREKNKSYYINTNGSLITDRHADLLTTSRCELSISLDAGDASTYRRMRSGGDWENVISGIKRVSQVKADRRSSYPLLYLTFHLNAINIRSMAKIPELARQLGIAAVKFSWTILPQTHRAHSVFRDQEKVAATIRSVSARLHQNGIQVRNGAVFDRHVRGCWNFSHMAFVGANGSLAACCSRWLTVGDLNDNAFWDIWNGMPRRSLALSILNRSPKEDCKDCPQIQGADYANHKDAFFKSADTEEKIRMEKTKRIGKLPSLQGLGSAFDAGVAALLNGNASSAAVIFSGLDSRFPDYFEIKNNLAVAHAYLGNRDKCCEVLHAITKIPHNKNILPQAWPQI
jgi:MoaA/NifB/PqqE/SkfB family radical SAM enzyme